MKLSENHTRAKKMVNSWPDWKKEVSLTKYSTNSSSRDSNAKSNAHDVDSNRPKQQKMKA